MNRFILASCIALLVLAPVLAVAQSRPTGGGTTVGTAAPRGGDTGTSSTSNSSSGSSSGTAVDRGASSTGSSGSSGSFSSPANVAVGRYDGPRSGESVGTARLRSGNSNVGQAVPASERPRGDTPAIGQAVPRASRPPSDNVIVIGGNPYYGYGTYGYYGWGYSAFYNCWPWSTYYYPCYGFLNPYYDPYGWWWGISPVYGWGMYALPLGAYSSLWSDYYAGASPSYMASTNGSIKLRVKPNDAEVYVDGTYYGKVDNYDGAFQHLELRSGTHEVEIRANGYETIQWQIRVLPGKTLTYNGEMKVLK